jgi:hypothetical protein
MAAYQGGGAAFSYAGMGKVRIESTDAGVVVIPT